MENEVLRDFLLVITVLIIVVVGFFIMKRLDKFLYRKDKPFHKDTPKSDDDSSEE